MSYQRVAVFELRDVHKRVHAAPDASPDEVMATRRQLIELLTPYGLARGRVPEVEPHALANTAPMTLLLWADDDLQRLDAYVIPNDQITPEQRAALDNGDLDDVEEALDEEWTVFLADNLADPTASPEWIDRRFTAAYAFNPAWE